MILALLFKITQWDLWLGFDLPPRKPEPPHKTLENIAATSSLGLRPQGKSAGAVSVQKDNVSVAKEYAVVKETA